MIRVRTVFAAASLAAFALPAVAQSFDDRPSTLAPILNMLGDSDSSKGEIDFRERAPIVIPKGAGAELPPPRPGTGPRVANWPQDQEVVRRRQDAAAARVPQQIEWNRNPLLSKRELMDGKSNEAPVAVSLCDTYVNGVQDCAPTSMEKLKRVFSMSGDADKDVVVVGKELPREYLTEPPRGYRTVTQTTRVTREAGYQREDASDPRAYLREQERRNSDYR